MNESKLTWEEDNGWDKGMELRKVGVPADRIFSLTLPGPGERRRGKRRREG